MKKARAMRASWRERVDASSLLGVALRLVVGDFGVLLAGRHLLALLVFALLLGDFVGAFGLHQPHLLGGLRTGLVLRIELGLGDLLLGLGLRLADVLGVVL